MGIEILEKYNYDFILFHDDDMDINENYISSLIESLNSDEDACGVSGIALDISLKKKPSWIGRFFIKDILSSRQGTVTRGGINKPVLIRDGSTKESEWLIGCSLWKRFPQNVKFENSLKNYAIFEDVIFSMKMRRILNKKLIVNTSINIIHRPSIRQKKNSKEIKFNWIKNRHLASQLFPETISTTTMWLVNVMYIFWTLFRVPLNPVKFLREFEGLVKGCLAVVRNAS
jgi:GT2 family glycosyltransferase